MKQLVVLALVGTTACGTMLNQPAATVTLPPGATIDGVPGTVMLSKKQSHQIVLADGRVCVLASSVSIGYVLADIFLTGLLGLVVDASTNDWRTLDAGTCPGVLVY